MQRRQQLDFSKIYQPQPSTLEPVFDPIMMESSGAHQLASFARTEEPATNVAVSRQISLLSAALMLRGILSKPGTPGMKQGFEVSPEHVIAL